MKQLDFLIRLMVGVVFLSEGLQKFLFPEELGIGRFVKIGIPSPQIMAPFVGVVEILFGVTIILGVFVGLSAVPLLINICVAIGTTKVPIFLNKGFWAAAHETRTDFCMLLGCLYLILKYARPDMMRLKR